MAKKKAAPPLPEDDEIPEGKVDEDGDEILDLDDERDNLDDDLDYDINNIEDDMLADEDEDEEFGPEIDEVVAMLRVVKCGPCKGSNTKEKFVPLTDAQRKKKPRKDKEELEE